MKKLIIILLLLLLCLITMGQVKTIASVHATIIRIEDTATYRVVQEQEIIRFKEMQEIKPSYSKAMVLKYAGEPSHKYILMYNKEKWVYYDKFLYFNNDIVVTVIKLNEIEK